MRITIRDKQRSFIGAWVLASLLMLGHNGLNLADLLDQPLLGYSQEVKGIRRQWKLLEQLGALTIREAKAVADVDLDRVFSRFEPVSILTGGDAEPAAKEEKEPSGPILPTLTGILSVSDLEGHVRWIAVVDGKRYREGDQVQGFTIQKIGEEGVYLTKWGTHWFVLAPEAEFTSVRAEIP
jgi:hypothetical protein